MQFIHYISTEKNKIFINQRKKALAKRGFIEIIDVDLEKNYKEIKEVFFFTLNQRSLRTFFKIKKVNKNINKISYFEVIHTAIYFGSSKFNNKFFFILSEVYEHIKIKIKFFVLNKFTFSLLKTKIDRKIILVNSGNKLLHIKNSFLKKKLIQCRPYIQKKYKKEKLVNYKINDNKSKNIFFFDSHFPLHPDSFRSKRDFKISKELMAIYLDFLDKNLSTEKNRYIFIHPRTFQVIKKNNYFLNYLKKFSHKFKFYNGVTSYLKFLNKKGDIIVQPGTQLTLLKNQLKINHKDIKILTLSNEFYKKFKVLKKKYNSQYLDNYQKIEIEQFKNLNEKKFKQYS
jgi:hypothetical protein